MSKWLLFAQSWGETKVHILKFAKKLCYCTVHNIDVYFHNKVPTNDGGIFFGQIMVANAHNL